MRIANCREGAARFAAESIRLSVQFAIRISQLAIRNEWRLIEIQLHCRVEITHGPTQLLLQHPCQPIGTDAHDQHRRGWQAANLQAR